MTLKNRWELIMVIPIWFSGCAARDEVVHPQEVKGLIDTQWKISQEPLSLSVEPPDIIEEEKDLFK